MSGLVVVSDRKWYGDQRLGSFVVYLDRQRVAVVPPLGRVSLRCTPGIHVVRIRQWWYFSPVVEVVVPDSTSLVLHADLAGRDSLLAAFVALVLTPWRGLALRVGSAVDSEGARERPVA